MKKKKIVVVDRINIDDVNNYDSLIEIITYCSKLYMRGYNQIAYYHPGLVAYKTREETDKEFKKRIQAEKKEKERLKLKKKKNKEKAKEERLKLYEKLKKEFENGT